MEDDFSRRLTAGADRTQVASLLLDAQGIQHGGYEAAGKDPVSASVLGAPAVIEARIPVNTWSLTQWSIKFVFRFDNQGHYINYTDQAEGTLY